MATAISPPALLSLEEYLHTSYHPDCDFVDGHLEDRDRGGRKHGRLQGRVATWFGTNEDAWDVYDEFESRKLLSAALALVMPCVGGQTASTPSSELTTTLHVNSRLAFPRIPVLARKGRAVTSGSPRTISASPRRTSRKRRSLTLLRCRRRSHLKLSCSSGPSAL